MFKSTLNAVVGDKWQYDKYALNFNGTDEYLVKPDGISYHLWSATVSIVASVFLNISVYSQKSSLTLLRSFIISVSPI